MQHQRTLCLYFDCDFSRNRLLIKARDAIANLQQEQEKLKQQLQQQQQQGGANSADYARLQQEYNKQRYDMEVSKFAKKN